LIVCVGHLKQKRSKLSYLIGGHPTAFHPAVAYPNRVARFVLGIPDGEALKIDAGVFGVAFSRRGLFLAGRHHADLLNAPGPSCGPWVLLWAPRRRRVFLG